MLHLASDEKTAYIARYVDRFKLENTNVLLPSSLPFDSSRQDTGIG